MAKVPAGVGPRFPQVVVLVGATGDLARRKLIPGLLHLATAGFIPVCRIVGVSLDEFDATGFRAFARGAVDEFSARKISDEDWNAFAGALDYVSLKSGPGALAAAVAAAEKSIGGECRRLHYLSVPPGAALAAVRMLGEAGLVANSRIMMEKPFGMNLASAVELNAKLHEVFAEEQIFRIDHFLGKEPAQNILAFRFANGLFEPIWNRNFIDHVQIDVPETLSLGKRTAFYESTGAYRDMVVTHLFQILGFVAMEAPTHLAPRAISEEKVKVFRSMLPIQPTDVVRGQYNGYRSEEGVSPESDTETFIALKCSIDNWRWAGVPFYLRTGKTIGGGTTHHLHRVSRAAQEHVSRGLRHRRARARSSDLRSRGRGAHLAVVLWKAAGSGHEARQAQPAVRDERHGPGRRRAGGVRATHPRCDAWRSHAVHDRGGHRATVGDLHAAARGASASEGILSGILGPECDPPARRAARLAVAVRKGLAGSEQTRQLRGTTTLAECGGINRRDHPGLKAAESRKSLPGRPNN